MQMSLVVNIPGLARDYPAALRFVWNAILPGVARLLTLVLPTINPAPKAGRERWMALGQYFTERAAIIKAEDETGSERFLAASSDERFRMLFDRLSRKQPTAKPDVEDMKDNDGKVFARVSRSDKGLRIEFPADPGFGFAAVGGTEIVTRVWLFVAGAGLFLVLIAGNLA
ncbi:hypothetical protein B4Q13_17035, partial [Lacticaseibacillus rhamnosus]